MTGFRVGFACGPDWLIEAMMKIHQYCMMCAPILSQEAAVEALRHGTGDVIRMKEQYQKRRDFIVRRFNEIGLDCHSPRGSFYAFPSVESLGLKEIDFCHRLLREQEVAVVPVAAFETWETSAFVQVSPLHMINSWRRLIVSSVSSTPYILK